MATIKIDFKGVCTHLVPSSWHGPQFQIEDGKVAHRVFLANPKLIDTHIAPGAGVPQHIPKLRIRVADETPDTQMIPGMVKSGDWWEALLLSHFAISFEGVDDAKPGDLPPGHMLHEKVPHVLNKHKGQPPQPRQLALKGWTHHAAAIIDFAGAVKLETSGKINEATVKATLTLKSDPKNVPKIAFRFKNEGSATSYALKPDTTIEITNLPEGTEPEDTPKCLPLDYLLHYFVTTLDMCEDPPQWPKPKEVSPPIPELYCGSTTYP